MKKDRGKKKQKKNMFDKLQPESNIGYAAE